MNNTQGTGPLPTVPLGYDVTLTSPGSGEWTWESILAPECHSSTKTFPTYAEALRDCVHAQGDDHA